MSKVHGCPILIIIFHVQWTVKLGKKSDTIGNMRYKFQVDWTSASSKTTLAKNFNMKQDRTDERKDERMDERTNAQTRKHNAPT